MTATFAGGTDRTGGFRDLDPFNTSLGGVSLNWFNQGADAGRYANDDIHAIRILAMEPTTDRQRGPKSGRTFRSHANERLRILGEIPVRKFPRPDLDAERRRKNREASRSIPTATPTPASWPRFRRRGLHVPDARQERHGPEHGPDLAPAPARRDPQRLRRLPRPQPEADPLQGHRGRQARLPVFDLTEQHAAADHQEERSVRQEVGQRGRDRPALREGRQERRVFPRRQADPRPQLRRLPYAEARAAGRQPGPGRRQDGRPAQRRRRARHLLPAGDGLRRPVRPASRSIGSWRNANASRYVRMFQSRRSLLIWKVFGRRTDGWTNDDFPTETVPGDPQTLQHKGKPVAEHARRTATAPTSTYTGSIMPPPEAVAGTSSARTARRSRSRRSPTRTA